VEFFIDYKVGREGRILLKCNMIFYIICE